jgi:hypothetical protein
MSTWERNADCKRGNMFECKKVDTPGDQIKIERAGHVARMGDRIVA